MNGTRSRKEKGTLAAVAAAGLFFFSGPPARASDSAILQFTVPAPNPVQAGETIQLQALAVNSGASAWPAGSYYWVAEIYDLEEKLVARTEQVSPRQAVASGGVASISLNFPVPDTMLGRRLYRIFLVKDAQQLLASELKPFRILEKPAPEKKKYREYRVEGNVTVSYKNASRNGWDNHAGATTANLVGKIKESSYLFNAYLLHERGDILDPFIVLFTYYAPWGTIYGGDISPTLSELSVNGQGLRGGMLEQKKDKWDWAVMGGQTVTSEPGTSAVNGRYARTLYALKVGRQLPFNLSSSFNYFLSGDEVGSLSTDPTSPNFRGPTLVPQKNSGYGLNLEWDPRPRLKFLAAYQKNEYFPDRSAAGFKDTAYKVEARWEAGRVKLKTTFQRAGPNFIAFGAPSLVGDRQTYSVAGSLYPAKWYTMSLSANQYTDNLANDPAVVTTTQRLLSTSHVLAFRTGTGLNLSFSQNAAKGKPASTLDNQTTSIGLGVSQSLGRLSGSLSLQNSAFRDKNKIADDLDTNTIALSTNFQFPGARTLAFGVTQSETKDKVDGSKRSSLTVSPSYSTHLRTDWTGQFWGTMTQSKNTSAAFPSDTQTLSANSEYSWAKSRSSNLTFGLGYNKHTDKFATAKSFNEITISTRYSYSF